MFIMCKQQEDCESVCVCLSVYSRKDLVPLNCACYTNAHFLSFNSRDEKTGPGQDRQKKRKKGNKMKYEMEGREGTLL